MDLGTRIVAGASALGADPGSSLVLIGNFDGVHRGHRAVLSSGAAEASRRGLIPLVLTFDPHPAEVLARSRRSVLTTVEHKAQLIGSVDPKFRVVVEPFTAELASLAPEEFVRRLLVVQLGARVVLVGENFRFGVHRSGDLAALRRLGGNSGFEARAQQLVRDSHGILSSTRVRAALAQGDLAAATAMLGRPHALSGVVAVGDGRGRTIGVPTANLSAVGEVLPPFGVYSCLVDQLDEAGAVRRLGSAVANIGVRPTVGAGRDAVEVHVLDFDEDLYGRTLRVHLLDRQRSEMKFSGLEQLREQIHRDIALARESIARLGPDRRLGSLPLSTGPAGDRVRS